MDARSDDVADENDVLKLLRKMIGGVVRHSGNSGRAMIVVGHLGAKPQTVVRLAKARIVGSPQQLVDGSAVAVGRVEIAQWIEGETERIDLAPRELLDVRTVFPHPVDVSRVHSHAG